MLRLLHLLGLSALVLVAGCDSGEPGSTEPEPDPTPTAPGIVGVSYVNKTFATVHLDVREETPRARAADGGRGGERYVRLLDLTVEFEQGVDPTALRRLRVFGTYGTDEGGDIGVGWEWSGSDLAAFEPSGSRLVLPDLALPREAVGDALLEVRAEADSVATYDFLHKGTFAPAAYFGNASWYGLDELDGDLYLDEDYDLPIEAVWLAEGGKVVVGRTAAVTTVGDFGQTTTRLEGVPATAEAVYFEAVGTEGGIEVISRSEVAELPQRLPPGLAFIDGIDPDRAWNAVPMQDGFLLRYLTPDDQNRLVQIGVDGIAAPPVALRAGIVSVSLSRDERSAWLAYLDGTIERLDLADRTVHPFLSVYGAAHGVVDMGEVLLASVCFGASESSCEPRLWALDPATGEVLHRNDTFRLYRHFDYRPEIGTLYAHESTYPQAYAFRISPDGVISEALGSTATSYYADWHLLPGGDAWVTSRGAVLRSTGDSDDLEQIGTYRFTDDPGSQEGADFASDAPADRLVSLHDENVYDRQLTLTTFALGSRARLSQLTIPGRRALGLIHTGSRYLALVTTDARLYALPITAAELDPARRALVSPVLPLQ